MVLAPSSVAGLPRNAVVWQCSLRAQGCRGMPGQSTGIHTAHKEDRVVLSKYQANFGTCPTGIGQWSTSCPVRKFVAFITDPGCHFGKTEANHLAKTMSFQQQQQRRALVWCILLLLVLGTGPAPEFTNWSGTLRGLPVERYFAPTNGNLPAAVQSADVQSLDFSSGLQALREILGNATANGKRVRAHGSKWSFSQVAYTDEYMVDSTGLNYVKIQFEDQPSWLEPAYQTELTRLAFVQAGVKMKHLQRALFDVGLTLSATGESDGQRLVGAVSTGAHGSAVEYGAIAEMVRAIHIVLPEEEVVIQRASNLVVTALFATDWLGASRLISDDALFNAAFGQLRFVWYHPRTVDSDRGLAHQSSPIEGHEILGCYWICAIVKHGPAWF
jgi:hypothetical protein